MKLLVAEDNDMLQELITMFIDSWGYDYDLASNGQEAVTLAKTHEGQYDLCLMDIEMPLLDGCEATRRIRRRLPYFPIMALTAHSDIEAISSEVGMDDYLVKPYKPKQLYQKIQELTVKSENVQVRNGEIFVQKEMPMDQQHAQEIRELKDKGLVKVKFGTNGEELILHKNTTNKISHDFNVKGHLISVFLHHDPDKPTRCELYRQYCHITQTYLDENDYEMEAREEKEDMERYPTRALTPEKENESDS